MRNIKSTFTAQSILTALLVIMILFSSLALCILPYFVDITSDGPGDSTLLWVALIVLISLIVTIVYFNKRFKKIIINDSGVMVSNLFRRKHYTWNDMSIINTELYSNDGDAIEIRTKNLYKEKFYTDTYSNRALLHQVFIFAKTDLAQGKIPTFEKFSYLEIPHRIAIEGLSRFVPYGRNQLFTINTCYISLFTAINIFALIPLIFKSETTIHLVSTIVLCLFMFLLPYLFARHMCCFQINDTYLLVQHPFLPISRTYLLSDIRQVAITEISRQSTALRVLTMDYNSDIFHAGGVRNREWSELLLHLKKNGVSILNDSVTKSFMK